MVHSCFQRESEGLRSDSFISKKPTFHFCCYLLLSRYRLSQFYSLLFKGLSFHCRKQPSTRALPLPSNFLHPLLSLFIPFPVTGNVISPPFWSSVWSHALYLHKVVTTKIGNPAATLPGKCWNWLAQHQFLLLLLFVFFCVPQLYLWGSPLWVRFLRMWPFSNPTIKVVTFRLRGWCVLGVFLLPAFTRLGHERQDLLSPCDEMHVCTD